MPSQTRRRAGGAGLEKASSSSKSDSPQQGEATTKHEKGGGGTVIQTTLNIAKTCMGSGTLALPYAACQGGFMFHVIGLILIRYWNVRSVDRLVRCLDLIPDNDDEYERTHEKNDDNIECLSPKNREEEDDDEVEALLPAPQEQEQEQQRNKRPSSGAVVATSTFGRVAWYAFGPIGLHALDGIIFILLMGVIIAYEAAIIDFIQSTPFTTHSPALDTLLLTTLIASLSCTPDLSTLSKFSAWGLFAIFFSFFIISLHALSQYNDSLHSPSFASISLYPRSLTGLCNWFGVIVFGFSVVPTAYNIRESMMEPDKMMQATKRALWMIYGTYVLVGDGVALLFLGGGREVEGDVLEMLPGDALGVATVVRLVMGFVIAVTAPLLVVPCADLLEGRLFVGGGKEGGGRLSRGRMVLRFGICLLCALISSVVPGFVYVISFIGCFCVGLTSFVLPPLFHIILVWRKSRAMCGDDDDDDDDDDDSVKISVHFDVIFLMWGIIATCVSSYLTLLGMLEQIRQ